MKNQIKIVFLHQVANSKNQIIKFINTVITMIFLLDYFQKINQILQPHQVKAKTIYHKNRDTINPPLIKLVCKHLSC